MQRTTWRGSLVGAAVLAGALAIATPARADVHISIGGWFDVPLPFFGPPVAYVPPPVYALPPPRPIYYAPAAYPVWYGHPGRHLGHYKHGWKHHGWKHGHGDWD